MIYTTIEAIINSIIPSDYIYKEKYKGKTIEHDYASIQRSIKHLDKLKRVLPDATSIDLRNFKDFSKYKNLVSLRNELIHMKSQHTSSIYNQKEHFDCEDKIINNLIQDSTISYIDSAYKLIKELREQIDNRIDFPIIESEEFLNIEKVNSIYDIFSKKD